MKYIAIHWDPSKYAWRSYRARFGAECAWFGLRGDALRWLLAQIEYNDISYSGL